MQPIYFSHGYREREAKFAEYFGNLLRYQNLVPSLDPPSESVNSAKLERHLRQTKGLVAIVADRDGNVSPHILYELSMAIRSGKPSLLFFEDSLSPSLFPSGIIKRRFSANSFIRETREHLHAVELLETYIGREHPPKFVSENDHRSCVFVGFENLQPEYTHFISERTKAKGYETVAIHGGRLSVPIGAKLSSKIRTADLAVANLDGNSPMSMYCTGVLRSSMVPTLLYSQSRNYPLAQGVPKEYQRKWLSTKDIEKGIEVIDKDLELYEEDFLELDVDKSANIYAQQLASISSVRGEYTESIRNNIIREVRLGDTYVNDKGQVGAMGAHAQASNFTFEQIWSENSNSIDLPKLVLELERLQKAMRSDDATLEQDRAILAVGEAKQAALKGEGSNVMKHLKSAGKIALDVGVKIGTAIAVEATKAAMRG